MIKHKGKKNIWNIVIHNVYEENHYLIHAHRQHACTVLQSSSAICQSGKERAKPPYNDGSNRDDYWMGGS